MTKNEEIYLAILMTWVAIVFLQAIQILTDMPFEVMAYFYVTGSVLTSIILYLIKLEKKFF